MEEHNNLLMHLLIQEVQEDQEEEVE